MTMVVVVVVAMVHNFVGEGKRATKMHNEKKKPVVGGVDTPAAGWRCVRTVVGGWWFRN